MFHQFRPYNNALSRTRVMALWTAIWLLLPSAAAAAIDDTIVQIQALEKRTNGALGVYVKDLHSGEELNYEAGKPWYLASLVKVPLAVAVLQAAQNRQLALSDSLVLQKSDFVDGSGEMLFAEPGSRHTIADLLQQSVEHSDSTATDMLMRKLGVEQFNQRIGSHMVKNGLGPFTTILQVRHDAYAELHPNAHKLSNMDYVAIRNADEYSARVNAFRKKLDLSTDQLRVTTLEEAFARYYQRDLNKGTLKAFGTLLERLVRGELLDEGHTDLLLGHMEKVTTGDKRLKAALPAEVPFAQKTGSQINRACSAGITNPHDLTKAVVLVVCVKEFGELENAERTIADVGKLLVANRRIP